MNTDRIQTPDSICLSHIQHTHTHTHTHMPAAHISHSHTHTVTHSSAWSCDTCCLNAATSLMRASSSAWSFDTSCLNLATSALASALVSLVTASAAVVVGWAAVAGAPVLVETVSAAGAVVAAVVGSVGCSAWATLALEVLVACVASARLFDLAPRLVLLHSSSLFVSLYLLYIDISCPCGGNVTAHKPVAARPWGEGEWGAHIGTTKLPDLRCRFHRCLLTVLPLDFVLNLADCSST